MTNPTDLAAVKPVAWACEADIRALKYPGDDISLSTEPLPRFGMKMPLYDASYGDQREKAAVAAIVEFLETGKLVYLEHGLAEFSNAYSEIIEALRTGAHKEET